MKDKILDDAFYTPNRFELLLEEDDILLWEGEPSSKHRTTLYEGNKNKITHLIIALSSLLVCLILLILNYSTFGFGGLSILIIIAIIFNCIMERVDLSKKRNTFYAISNDHIFIQRGKKVKIPFYYLSAFKIIDEKNGIKTFVFQTTGEYKKLNVTFHNMDHYIGIELIEDFITVKELLQKGMDK